MLILKCGLYPRIDSSSIRLGMIYTMDAYVCWGKRHNFSCSLGIVKISTYLYHPGERKPSLTIDEASDLFLKEINYN